MSDQQTKNKNNRTYKVLHDLGGGNIKTHLVIAANQSQAIRHVVHSKVHAEAISGLEVADLIRAGIEIEQAVEDKPTQEQLPA